VVIVGRVGRNRRDVAERLHQTPAGAGAPLLGVIANGFESNRGSYGYSYDYSYTQEGLGGPQARDGPRAAERCGVSSAEEQCRRSSGEGRNEPAVCARALASSSRRWTAVTFSDVGRVGALRSLRQRGESGERRTALPVLHPESTVRC
jgi:hypothetical protein